MSTMHDSSSEPKKPQQEGDRILAAISYLGFLCFIPLFLKKSNPFVQFHAKQGLVLFIAEIIISFINIIPILGQLAWLVAIVVFLFVSINGIIKSWQGVYWKIPVLSDYAKKINLD
jgi:fumarate reductase subunit D